MGSLFKKSLFSMLGKRGRLTVTLMIHNFKEEFFYLYYPLKMIIISSDFNYK